MCFNVWVVLIHFSVPLALKTWTSPCGFIKLDMKHCMFLRRLVIIRSVTPLVKVIVKSMPGTNHDIGCCSCADMPHLGRKSPSIFSERLSSQFKCSYVKQKEVTWERSAD